MENTFDLKKFLVENKLTKNSKLLKEEAAKEELQKQVFDFINSPKATAILTKVVDKLTPDQKEQLAKNLQTVAEGPFDNFTEFKHFTEKGLQASLSENKINESFEWLQRDPEEIGDKVLADLQRKYGEDFAKLEKNLKLGAGVLVSLVGGVLKTLGVLNIMSMGFLPAIVGAALDHFAGTNILYAAGALVGGSGGAAAALSVLAGLLGGSIAWWLGSALLGEDPSGDSALFE